MRCLCCGPVTRPLSIIRRRFSSVLPSHSEWTLPRLRVLVARHPNHRHAMDHRPADSSVHPQTLRFIFVGAPSDKGWRDCRQCCRNQNENAWYRFRFLRLNSATFASTLITCNFMIAKRMVASQPLPYDDDDNNNTNNNNNNNSFFYVPRWQICVNVIIVVLFLMSTKINISGQRITLIESSPKGVVLCAIKQNKCCNKINESIYYISSQNRFNLQ